MVVAPALPGQQTGGPPTTVCWAWTVIEALAVLPSGAVAVTVTLVVPEPEKLIAVDGDDVVSPLLHLYDTGLNPDGLAEYV